MRLKHQVVKELSEQLEAARQAIKRSEYQEIRDTQALDEVIEKLDELLNSKSKLVDYSELKSDVKFLKEYYEERSWNDVTRWLTNINSTLRETFSSYMDAVTKLRNEDNNIKKHEITQQDESF